MLTLIRWLMLKSKQTKSFRAANQYGGKAADYLTAFRQASRAGYEDAKGIAELSLATLKNELLSLAEAG